MSDRHRCANFLQSSLCTSPITCRVSPQMGDATCFIWIIKCIFLKYFILVPLWHNVRQCCFITKFLKKLMKQMLARTCDLSEIRMEKQDLESHLV